MNSKLFAQYLLDNGLIDRRQMQEVVAAQRAANAEPSSLAVDLGLLTSDDLQAVRSEQLRTAGPFGKTAVSLGLLSQTQVDELHSRQREQKKVLLTELLVERGYVDAERLAQAQSAYQREDRARSERLEELMEAAESGEVAQVVLGVLEGLYRRVMGHALHAQEAEARRSIQPADRLWTQVLLAQGKSYLFGLQMHESSALKIGEVVLGAKVLRFDDLIEDAVAEFFNLVLGHACAQLNVEMARAHATPAPPRVTCGADLLRDHPDPLVIRCDSGEVRFYIAVGDPREVSPGSDAPQATTTTTVVW